MTIARTLAISVIGLEGQLVEVEANLTTQTPDVTLIGLPDTSLREAHQRIKSAVLNSGAEMPRRRLVINLIPAGVPKHGTGFDLAIAVAAMITTEIISNDTVENTVYLGELGLDGRLRPVPGVLPAVRAAAQRGVPRAIVPMANAEEARLVAGIEIIPMVSLNEVLRYHGAEVPEIVQDPVVLPKKNSRKKNNHQEPDLSDIVGNPDAIEAAMIAAAGGHNLLLIGPPGSGKSMVAERFTELLPELNDEQALEASCLQSIMGSAGIRQLNRKAPLVAPHHTATPVSIIGGGSQNIRPGAAVMATHGVLFLDEATEFSRVTLDSLRQPIETGKVRIHRAKQTVDYPAKFQLVLATNPCPCGNYTARGNDCTCPVALRKRYLARLSGPLLDRVDLRVHTHRITSAQLNRHHEVPGISTQEAQKLVAAARQRAQQRLADTNWSTNAEVSGTWLRSELRLSPKVTSGLDLALESGRITMRGYDRILRVSWTLADLVEREFPGRAEIGKALYLRQAVQ